MNELQNLLTSAKDADKLISVGADSLEQLGNGILVILIWFAVIFLLTYTVLFCGKKSKRDKKGR